MLFRSDVLVEALDDRGQERSTREPIFACEVLSPSSLDTDFDDKPTEYGAMATLQYYLVAAQDAPTIWLWTRGADGRFSERGQRIEGIDAVVDLPFFGVSLPLVGIYRAIRAS